jgi:hypothetical protein
MADPAAYAGVPAYGSTAVYGSTDSYAAPQAVAPVEHSGYVGGAPAACFGDDCGHCCPSRCRRGSCLHRSGAFGEYLYWQASGVNMPYAVPQDGIGGPGTVQQGRVATLDYDHEAAFRMGAVLALNCCSSMSVTYTRFETNTEDVIAADPPRVIRPLVTHPGTFNAGATSQVAVAASSLEMSSLDSDYRAVLISGRKFYINYLVGGRYAELDQSFLSLFPFAPPDGATLVATEIDFEGLGMRLGLEGERSILPKCGICLYGKAVGSLVGGEFSATYAQANQFNGLEVFAAWEDARLVPIAELEAGLSWMTRCGRLRLSAGYYFGMWMNTVITQDWINAVQAVNFSDVGQDAHDSIRFDGLVARAEVRL